MRPRESALGKDCPSQPRHHGLAWVCSREWRLPRRLRSMTKTDRVTVSVRIRGRILESVKEARLFSKQRTFDPQLRSRLSSSELPSFQLLALDARQLVQELLDPVVVLHPLLHRRPQGPWDEELLALLAPAVA